MALADSNLPHDRHPGTSRMSGLLHLGSRGGDVAELQRNLGELGYILSHDGKFGPNTRAAVKSFQQAHGLETDGIVGATTSTALTRASQELAGRLKERPVCLDDPSHPDHAFYQQAHSLVCELDRRHGRTSDQFSSNLASALVVSGREAGLARINRLVMGDNGAAIWGAQNLPGSHLIEKLCRVDVLPALNSPMEQSAIQWAEVMQTYARQQEGALARDNVPAPQVPALLVPHVR